jgi:hypothetical protein
VGIEVVEARHASWKNSMCEMSRRFLWGSQLELLPAPRRNRLCGLSERG